MPIPSSGQFKIFPSTFLNIVNGTYSQSSAGAPPAQSTQAQIATYLDSEVNDPATAPRMWEQFDSGGGIYVPIAGTYELQMFPKTRITFDTLGTPDVINFTDADFPLGVRFYALHLFLFGQLNWDGRNKRVTSFIYKYKNTVEYTLVPSVNLTNIDSGEFTGYNPIVNPGPYYAPNQIFGGVTGIQSIVAAGSAGGSVPNLTIYQHFLYGTYQSNWMTLTATANANPGDIITINDALSKLNTFEKFKVYWKANSDSTEYSGGVELPIQSQAAGSVQLFLPPNMGLPYGQRKMYVVGVADEAQNYFGEFGLAYINNTVIDPTLVNGSGIYTLDPSKRNDTYYDRSVSPVITTDIKIPDPYIKTGFFNA